MIRTGLLSPGSHRAASLCDDRAVARAILRVEAAWVTAQAEYGAATAAQAEAARATVDDVTLEEQDLAELAVAGEGGGNPVIPLLARYRAAVRERAGHEIAAVHASLTSQDVLDTALSLVRAEAERALRADLARTGDALAGLVTRHAATPAVARTLTQHALPTTFGLRVASWLSGVDDAAALLDAAPAPAVSFGGAAGTLAAGLRRFGGHPDQPEAGNLWAVLTAWARELGLAVPPAVWHVDRVPVIAAGSALVGVTTALGHIGNDVALASRPEIGELREPTAPGRGVSSAMPQKQNPVLSVLLRRTAISAPGLFAQLAAGAAAAVDERPDGGWHAEWPAYRELLELTTAAASHAAELVTGLRVNDQRMLENLRAAGTGVASERLVAALREQLPERDGAWCKSLVQDAVSQHPDDPTALARELSDRLADERFDDTWPGASPDKPSGQDIRAWLEHLVDPTADTGAAAALCARAVARHEALAPHNAQAQHKAQARHTPPAPQTSREKNPTEGSA